MKICIITYGYPTPIDPNKYVFVDQLACAWAEMGNEVTVIYPVPRLVELVDKRRFYRPQWTRNTLGGSTVSVVCPRFFSASDKTILGVDTKTISYWSFQKVVVRAINSLKNRPDVLYGHFLPSGCQAGDIGIVLGISSFCAFGESTLWSIEGWNLNKTQKSLAKLSGIVSVSTENKRVLAENNLYREKDIEVFPNGVDHSLFFPRDKLEMRRKYGFPEDTFIGAFTGAFNDDKGVLRAQEAAVKSGNTRMLYIGGGASKPNGANILFSGKLPHESIPEYLSAADFFILPTRAEGCCNAIIEAMACGLPIISASGAYNDDILADTYSIRTSPTDVEAMAEALKMLRDDPERRSKMSAEAKRASAKFDIAQRASAIIDFMQRKMKKVNWA